MQTALRLLLCAAALLSTEAWGFWSTSTKKKEEPPTPTPTPTPIRVNLFLNGENRGAIELELTPEDCSRSLIEAICLKLPAEDSATCSASRIFSETAVQLTTCSDVAQTDLYFVPVGRHFIFPTRAVGHSVLLPHIGSGVELRTLSESPRVFELLNLFSEEEADALIQEALSVTDEGPRLKQDGVRVDTSDRAFDSTSNVAIAIKTRIFVLLGLATADAETSMADGLQLHRFNVAGAYEVHSDYLEGQSEQDSEGEGVNRFAHVILYLSDVEEGGETVFPAGQAMHSDFDVDEYLEQKGLTAVFEGLDWEKELISVCRTGLTSKPKKLKAVLYYLQHPDKSADVSSVHGSCPVIVGQKWTASLWVWNGPFTPQEPQEPQEPPPDAPVIAFFSTLDVPEAELSWGEDQWGRLPLHSEGKPLSSTTYEGHEWVVTIGDRVVAVWVISDDSEQEFVLRREDIDSEQHEEL